MDKGVHNPYLYNTELDLYPLAARLASSKMPHTKIVSASIERRMKDRERIPSGHLSYTNYIRSAANLWTIVFAHAHAHSASAAFEVQELRANSVLDIENRGGA